MCIYIYIYIILCITSIICDTTYDTTDKTGK